MHSNLNNSYNTNYSNLPRRSTSTNQHQQSLFIDPNSIVGNSMDSNSSLATHNPLNHQLISTQPIFYNYSDNSTYVLSSNSPNNNAVNSSVYQAYNTNQLNSHQNDSISTDFDFLLNSNLNSHISSNSLSNSTQKYSVNNTIIHRPPPLTTPATLTFSHVDNHHHMNHHQELEDDNLNNVNPTLYNFTSNNILNPIQTFNATSVQGLQRLSLPTQTIQHNNNNDNNNSSNNIIPKQLNNQSNNGNNSVIPNNSDFSFNSVNDSLTKQYDIDNIVLDGKDLFDYTSTDYIKLEDNNNIDHIKNNNNDANNMNKEFFIDNYSQVMSNHQLSLDLTGITMHNNQEIGQQVVYGNQSSKDAPFSNCSNTHIVNKNLRNLTLNSATASPISTTSPVSSPASNSSSSPKTTHSLSKKTIEKQLNNQLNESSSVLHQQLEPFTYSLKNKNLYKYNNTSEKCGIVNNRKRGLSSKNTIQSNFNNTSNNFSEYELEMPGLKRVMKKNDFEEDYADIFSKRANPPEMKIKINEPSDLRCWVCAEPSSGNHYGALTCEACKLFFRRHTNTLTQLANLQSTTTGQTAATIVTVSPSSASSSSSSENRNVPQQCLLRNCVINQQTRGQCPECRYRKCIAVGMGLNRTTFGRHTTIQKNKYHTRVPNLFFEIMRLFESLKSSLDQYSTNNGIEFLNLMIPYRLQNNDSKVINSRGILENNLNSFYNQVIDLVVMQNSNSNNSKQMPTKLPIKILLAFCLIFDYNLKSINVSNEKLMSQSQLKHIHKQFKDLDDQYGQFAIRIKIIYFILIMFTSFSANAIDNCCYDFVQSTQISNNMLPPSSSTHLMQFQNKSQNNTSFSVPIGLGLNSFNLNGRANPYDEIIDHSLNIQRTFLDLLNSELDFGLNNVSATRVSLLLKLEQFI